MYDYDELNRLTSVISSDSEAISSYTYDALSRRTAASYLNGTSVSYTYDAVSRLTELTNNYLPASNTYTYTYDKVGNRLSKTDSTGTENYTYDNIYQVTNVTYPDTTTTAYNYDPLGNRTTVTNATATTYTSNNLNQYTSVGGITYTYDANGNLTYDGTNTYTYDSENRLVIASLPQAGEAIYTYDPFGRRTSKTVDGVTTDYLYDGDQVIAEYDASGTLTAKYIYGTGIDEVVTMNRGGATYYYHYDGLGSVTALTDSSGDLTEAYSYDIFGGVTSSFSSVGNSYYFTGRRYDSETGLYYYRARYYSPGLGRFLQRDPVGYVVGINLYTYCLNNPINFIDPFGLKTYKIQGGDVGVSIYAVVGGGAGVYKITDMSTGETATYTVINFGVGIGGHVDIHTSRYFESDVPNVKAFSGRSWELDFVPLFYKQAYNTKIGAIENYSTVGGATAGVEISANFVYFWLRDYTPGKTNITIGKDTQGNSSILPNSKEYKDIAERTTGKIGKK